MESNLRHILIWAMFCEVLFALRFDENPRLNEFCSIGWTEALGCDQVFPFESVNLYNFLDKNGPIASFIGSLDKNYARSKTKCLVKLQYASQDPDYLGNEVEILKILATGRREQQPDILSQMKLYAEFNALQIQYYKQIGDSRAWLDPKTDPGPWKAIAVSMRTATLQEYIEESNPQLLDFKFVRSVCLSLFANMQRAHDHQITLNYIHPRYVSLCKNSGKPFAFINDFSVATNWKSENPQHFYTNISYRTFDRLIQLNKTVSTLSLNALDGRQWSSFEGARANDLWSAFLTVISIFVKLPWDTEPISRLWQKRKCSKYAYMETKRLYDIYFLFDHSFEMIQLYITNELHCRGVSEEWIMGLLHHIHEIVIQSIHYGRSPNLDVLSKAKVTYFNEHIIT